MNRLVRFMALFLGLAAIACDNDQTTAPEGTPSQVNVVAYVDANGNGISDTGEGLVGAGVTLLGADGTSMSATTDASGVATFADVAPGSYQASFGGPSPVGAVLASASGPVVVAQYAGGTVQTEFRFVFNPGTISGRLFRDNNGNGTFDSGTDTPAPGIQVRLFSGTDTTAAALATTTTSTAGEFSFTTVRPGSYTLVYSPLPTMTLVGGNTQTVNVVATQTAQAEKRFTGNLILTIAEARALSPVDSPLVAIEGTVTAGTGTFNARSFYLQDGTAGMLVFGVDTALIKPQPGARVRVIGRMIAFNDELEIILPTVTSIGTAAVPAPRAVTGAQINAFSFQGELARAQSVTVVSVATGTSASYDVRVRDAAGTEFVVRVAGIGANNIPRTFWTVGNTYDVTGILNRFRTTAQLAPRSPADVTIGVGPQTIASIKTQPVGTRVTTVGVATVGAGATAPFGARTFYIQDATSGIMVFFSPSASAVPVAAGDSVRVSGVMNTFSGELEVDTAQVTTLRSGAAIPAPRVVTGAQIAARTFEGQLVRVNDVEIVTVPTGTGATFTVIARAPDGTQFEIRIANANTGITRANFTAGARYDLIGILGSFNGTAQLKPRTTADIIPR